MKYIAVFILFLTSFSLVSAVDFDVSVPFVKSVIQEGDSVGVPVEISNTGLNAQRFALAYSPNGSFVSLDSSTFIVEQGESVLVNVSLHDPGFGLGVYSGEIVIEGESGSFLLPVVLEVESSEVLFDVTTTLPPRFSDVTLGEEFEVDIKLYNLGTEASDVSIMYQIIDLRGGEIFSASELLTVSDQVAFTKSFTVPLEVDSGDYVFSVAVRHENSVGTSTLLLPLSEPSFFLSANVILFLLVVLVFLLVFYNSYLVNRIFRNQRYWDRRIHRLENRINHRIVKKQPLTSRRLLHERDKLEYELRLLEKAYGQGYIKQQSYVHGKAKIQKMIRTLRSRRS